MSATGGRGAYALCHKDRARSSGGFTLIELLIVMTIVGLLAVAFLPQISGVWGLGSEADTTARIAQLRAMIERYERDRGDYPPSEFSRAAMGVIVSVDSTNVGIESLLIHLHQRSLGNLSLENRDWLMNTDQDHNSAEIPELFTTEKLEVVDAWGTPLVYFHNISYGTEQLVILGGEGVDGSSLTAQAMSDERGYLNPRKFQIISAGGDGEFGTDDDITYPNRH